MLEGYSDSVWSVAFSLNSRLLASSSSDNTVRLWDPVTGVLVQIQDIGTTVTTIEFFNDGLYIRTNTGILDI